MIINISIVLEIYDFVCMSLLLTERVSGILCDSNV